MNKKLNNKLLKKTQKKRSKRIKGGGGGTKKYVIKFAVDDPKTNSIGILKELTSGSIGLDANKITVVGIEGNPTFTSDLQNLINGDSSLDPALKLRFGSTNGYITDDRKKQIFAESAAAQAKEEEEKTIKAFVTAHENDLNQEGINLLDLTTVFDSSDDDDDD